ncbi:hypothetical protein DFS33DRAFT_1380607 [Desarmillaria ectypa]|nr:hypothetical protein DFS33DRAFT_1380607 [Desarmillaria ectypa]
MPVTVLLGDLDAIKPEDIRDPWVFFQELEALKRFEGDFKERIKAKTQVAVECARQKDEALYAGLHSEMLGCIFPPEVEVQRITSDSASKCKLDTAAAVE